MAIVQTDQNQVNRQTLQNFEKEFKPWIEQATSDGKNIKDPEGNISPRKLYAYYSSVHNKCEIAGVVGLGILGPVTGAAAKVACEATQYPGSEQRGVTAAFGSVMATLSPFPALPATVGLGLETASSFVLNRRQAKLFAEAMVAYDSLNFKNN